MLSPRCQTDYCCHILGAYPAKRPPYLPHSLFHTHHPGSSDFHSWSPVLWKLASSQSTASYCFWQCRPSARRSDLSRCPSQFVSWGAQSASCYYYFCLQNSLEWWGCCGSGESCSFWRESGPLSCSCERLLAPFYGTHALSSQMMIAFRMLLASSSYYQTQ